MVKDTRFNPEAATSSELNLYFATNQFHVLSCHLRFGLHDFLLP